MADAGAKSYRASELDGLRGLAAFVVYLCHFAIFFVPAILYGELGTGNNRVTSAIHNTPLNLFTNGDFAVSIFFVLSGYVLSVAYLKDYNPDRIQSLAFRRYFRLMIPVLASLLIAHTAVKLGLLDAKLLQKLPRAPYWATQLWSTPATFWHIVWQGLWGSFWYNSVTYSQVLWTMHYEFVGSLLVFAMLLFMNRATEKKRKIFIVCGLVVFALSYYWCFVAGTAIAYGEVNIRKHAKNKSAWLLIIAIVLGAFPLLSPHEPYLFLVHFLSNEKTAGMLSHNIASVLLICGVLTNETIKKVFRSVPLQILGKLSFSMYLLHLTVLGVVSPILFGILIKHFSYPVSTAFAFLGVTACVMFVSLAFMQIDEAGMCVAKKLEEKMYATEP